MNCSIAKCEDEGEHPYGFVVEGTDGSRIGSDGRLCQFHAQQLIVFFGAEREASSSTVARQAAEIFSGEFENPDTNGVVIHIDKKRLR